MAKRYDLTQKSLMCRSKTGEFVKYDDYKKLVNFIKTATQQLQNYAEFNQHFDDTEELVKEGRKLVKDDE